MFKKSVLSLLNSIPKTDLMTPELHNYYLNKEEKGRKHSY
jgi:hypothetical protein